MHTTQYQITNILEHICESLRYEQHLNVTFFFGGTSLLGRARTRYLMNNSIISIKQGNISFHVLYSIIS